MGDCDSEGKACLTAYLNLTIAAMAQRFNNWGKKKKKVEASLAHASDENVTTVYLKLWEWKVHKYCILQIKV